MMLLGCRPRSQRIYDLPAVTEDPHIIHEDEFPVYPRLERITMLHEVLTSKKGYEMFMKHLQNEYSEENLVFWTLIEDFKAGHLSINLREAAIDIYNNFIDPDAGRQDPDADRQVNLSSQTVRSFERAMLDPAVTGKGLLCVCMNAQREIYTLMERDSFPRFMKSPEFQQLREGACFEINSKRFKKIGSRDRLNVRDSVNASAGTGDEVVKSPAQKHEIPPKKYDTVANSTGSARSPDPAGQPKPKFKGFGLFKRESR